MVQGWVWRELEQYKTRICEIGVDGHALYNLEGMEACTWHKAAAAQSYRRLSCIEVSRAGLCAYLW